MTLPNCVDCALATARCVAWLADRVRMVWSSQGRRRRGGSVWLGSTQTRSGPQPRQPLPLLLGSRRGLPLPRVPRLCPRRLMLPPLPGMPLVCARRRAASERASVVVPQLLHPSPLTLDRQLRKLTDAALADLALVGPKPAHGEESQQDCRKG